MGILLNTAGSCGADVFSAAAVPRIYGIRYVTRDFQDNRLSASVDNVAAALFVYRAYSGSGGAGTAYTADCLDNKNRKKSKQAQNSRKRRQVCRVVRKSGIFSIYGNARC